MVDPATLGVTCTSAFLFADNKDYGTTFDVTGMSASQYLIAYYIGQSKNESISTVVMNAQKSATNGTYYLKPLGPVSKLPGSLVEGTIRVTSLDDNTAVIAYSDRTSNYGITCVLVESNLNTGVVNFISKLQITTGYSAKYISSGTVDINLVTITAGTQFMVLFSDLGLDGAIVAAIGSVCASQMKIKVRLFHSLLTSRDTFSFAVDKIFNSSRIPQLHPERRYRNEEQYPLLHISSSEQVHCIRKFHRPAVVTDGCQMCPQSSVSATPHTPTDVPPCLTSSIIIYHFLYYPYKSISARTSQSWRFYPSPLASLLTPPVTPASPA